MLQVLEWVFKAQCSRSARCAPVGKDEDAGRVAHALRRLPDALQVLLQLGRLLVLRTHLHHLHKKTGGVGGGMVRWRTR